jgi:hypothetical protein
MKTGISGASCTLAFALALSAAIPAVAQEKVGVVTTVVGPVTIARASLPPEPLKFKDDVFVRDRVTTGENAITRILLGGKVIVTARERSTLTITEVPGLSTIDLAGGRIAVAVEKSLMKPGERVDIRTPHAVAGVRGTVLIVEAQSSSSTVTVLRGLVHVTRLNSATGLPVGGFTPVAAQQAVTVRNNVLPSRAQTIAPLRAQELTQEFSTPMKAVSTPVAVLSEDLQQVRSVATLDPAGADADVEKPRFTGATLGRTGGNPAGKGNGSAAPAASVAPVAAPAPVITAAPVPASGKVTVPNVASSLLTSSGKVSKEDRSGSNRGKH